MSKCYDNPDYDDLGNGPQNTWEHQHTYEQKHEAKVMKNIYILQTDKPSRLACDFDKLILNSRLLSPILYKTQNIYITSDEEIKEGDWFLHPFNTIHKAGGNLIDKDFKKIILTTDELYIHNDLIPKEYNPFPQYIQKIDDEFLEWFIKNPSCEEIKVEEFEPIYGHQNNSSSVLYKTIIPKEEICSFCDGTGQVVSSTTISRFKTCDCKIIPKEEPKQENCCTPIGQIKRYVDCIGCDRKPKQECKGSFKDCFKPLDECVCDTMKQETLEEASEKFRNKNPGTMQGGNNTKILNAFKAGAKWQQERSYSEEEMIDLIQFLSMNEEFNGYGSVSEKTAKHFLEQFKKK